MATVPDKRNPSKQRRAARNRATRDSLAARRENAVPDSPAAAPRSAKAAPAAGSTSRTSTKGAARGGTARGGARGGARPARPVPVAVGPAPKGFKELAQSRRPGDRALLGAFVISIVSALFSLLVVQVDVDDRGELIPYSWGALTLLAREQATGHAVTVSSDSLIGAYGPIIILLQLTPVLITGYALWVNRRTDRARVLTFVLIAMAVATMLSGVGASILQTILSFGALITLGVGVFRVRKADMEAGMAATTASGSGPVIEAETTDTGDTAPKSLLQRLLGPGAAAGGGARGAAAGTEAADEDEVDDVLDVEVVEDDDPAAPEPSDADTNDDPLAELEAELAAEADAPADASDDDTPSGNGRGRRRR